MKKLVKYLAVVALVLMVTAVSHAIVRALAVGPYGEIAVNGKIDHPPITDPDINIKIRGFGRLDSKIGDERLRTVKTCASQVDPRSPPKLCGLFSDHRIPMFTNLYAVGQRDTGKIPAPAALNPPHVAGMKVSPGSPVLVPPATGYGLGGGYAAMVVFLDDDSIMLKYTNFDDFSDANGYAIHIIGIRVDADLVQFYDELNSPQSPENPKGGRNYLPGVRDGQQIGTAVGSEIWVSIRDSGSFMDPRWYEDWWAGCGPATPPDPNFSPGPIPSETTLANIGSSTPIHTSQSGTADCPIVPGSADSQGANQIGTVFPPIHTLQTCPPEVSNIGYVNPQSPVLKGTESTCGIVPQPEPTECAGIKDPINGGYCSVTYSLRRWCNPDTSCKSAPLGSDGNPINNDCSINPNGNGRCGQGITGFCLNDPFKRIVERMQNGVCDPQIATVDQDVLAKCIWYFQSKSPGSGVKPSFAQVPACIPTSSNGKCVTECSEPIQVQENYTLFGAPAPIKNCVSTRDCVMKMSLEQPNIDVPFIRNLADYFAGYLDSGGVADGSISQEQLDDIKRAIAGGDVTKSKYYELVRQGFKAAGVARKLLPREIQDELKCQFIKGVKSRVIAKRKDPVNGPNTKYLFYKDAARKELDEFKIDKIKISDFELPPYFDQSLTSGCRRTAADDSAWRSKPSGIAWVDVPLFDNEDAQGEIQFVSPSLYSSLDKRANPKNPLGPIYISVPEIRRLSSASAVLQQALMPKVNVEFYKDALSKKIYPEAIGKPVQIAQATDRIAKGLLACQPTLPGVSSWDKFYSSTQSQTFENDSKMSVFDRGVLCQVQPVTDKADSQICSVGPDGQLLCYREDTSTDPKEQRLGKVVSGKQTVQVRTVMPYLFDIAQQTISSVSGLLRIFEPVALQQGFTKNQFDQKFEPLPAASNKVRYKLTGGFATIDDPKEKDGWRIYLYKLGGVWNAKEFILRLLNPPPK